MIYASNIKYKSLIFGVYFNLNEREKIQIKSDFLVTFFLILTKKKRRYNMLEEANKSIR